MKDVFRNRLNRPATGIGQELEFGHGFGGQLRMDRRAGDGHGLGRFLGGSAKAGPIHIWTKFLASHRSVGCTLNGRTSLRWNLPDLVCPLVHGNRTNPKITA